MPTPVLFAAFCQIKQKVAKDRPVVGRSRDRTTCSTAGLPFVFCGYLESQGATDRRPSVEAVGRSGDRPTTGRGGGTVRRPTHNWSRQSAGDSRDSPRRKEKRPHVKPCDRSEVEAKGFQRPIRKPLFYSGLRQHDFLIGPANGPYWPPNWTPTCHPAQPCRLRRQRLQRRPER